MGSPEHHQPTKNAGNDDSDGGSGSGAATSTRIRVSSQDSFAPIHQLRIRNFNIVRADLDSQALQQALTRLIERHIPLLGARLHGTRINQLQYVLPRGAEESGQWPEGYELFRWTEKTIGGKLDDAGLLGEQARSTEQTRAPTTLGPSVAKLEAAWAPAEWATTRKGEGDDAIMLLVHLIRYDDACVLAINMPHAVGDQLGVGAFMSAWLGLLDGKTPLPFLKLSPDALDGYPHLGPAELRKVTDCHKLYGKVDRALLWPPVLKELVTESSEERRILCIREDVVTRVKNDINKTLHSDGAHGVTLVTNGDALVAIVMKLIHLRRQKPRRTVLSAPINVRGRHPALPASMPYLHNAIVQMFAPIAISRDTPLAEIAVTVRERMLKALEPDQIQTRLAVTREMARQGVSISLPTQRGYSMNTVINWVGAWRDLDFAHGVTGKADTTAAQRDGDQDVETSRRSSIPIVLGDSFDPGVPSRFGIVIMCRAEGQYWIDFTAVKKSMTMVEELLKRDPELRSL